MIGFYISCYSNLFLRVELENNTICSHTATPTFRQFPWDSVSLEGLCPPSFNPALPGRIATQSFSCVHAELKNHFKSGLDASSGHHSAKHCLLSLQFHHLLLLTGIISSVILIGARKKWKLQQKRHKLVLHYRLLNPLHFYTSGCYAEHSSLVLHTLWSYRHTAEHTCMAYLALKHLNWWKLF